MLLSWWNDKSGATIVYVTLMMAVLMGMVGLSLDFGRNFILRAEVQAAADAAARAGASQLDGTIAGRDRANTAALGTPITPNAQKLGQTPGAITIASTNFYATVPADDDDPLSDAAPPYDFIEVVTSAQTHENIFLRALGVAGTSTVTASAVARRGQAVCQFTPLAICNPEEATTVGAGFNPEDYYGKQIRIIQHGSGSSWAPGNFGFLKSPGSSGAKDQAEEIANGRAGICTSNGADTRPGRATSIDTAFNTRFDMYENPFFKNADNDPAYPPAENVGKGYDTEAGGYCNSPAEDTTGRSAKFPRDNDLIGANRFGNGQWNCLSYWNVAHGPSSGASAPPPAGCTDPAASDFWRYDLYRYEIANGLVPQPNDAGGPPATPTYVEDGDPTCFKETVPPTPTDPDKLRFDRRILTFAVMNCVEHSVNGSETDVPVLAYINGFMTEAVEKPPNAELYLEVVGSSASGNEGVVPVVLKDWVELVR
ncbi:MAG: hypothetical protein HKP25_11680 [Marinicaulis sp.]|nr:hypothetical protein [Marinicaulis sp.]